MNPSFCRGLPAHAPIARQVNIAMGLTAATIVQLDSTDHTAAQALHAGTVGTDRMHPQVQQRAPRALVADGPLHIILRAAPIARAAQDNT